MSSCDNNCSSCGENCSDRRNPQSLLVPANEYSNVKNIIGVVSGKGGVGKSLVTSLMSVLMQKKGYETAIIDGDITGPSIPKAFGLHNKVYAMEEGIIPAVTENGTKVMSINLILENETDPVLWRGPIIAGQVSQFWSEVVWGDVDYMFVDMPPGTGDIPLTVFQSLPLSGIIIVTSPQELVGMVVEKAFKMANLMNIPVLGIVENMSYFKCPDCGKNHHIFGESKVERIAGEYNIETIAKLPMDPNLSRLCDEGRIEEFEGDYLDAIVKSLI